MVFVNLFHAPLGKAMSYGTAYELFCRLASDDDAITPEATMEVLQPAIALLQK